MKKYSLTPEHRAQLEPWRDKWIANAMSTNPMTDEDRTLCVKAAHGIYSSAKLPVPKHVVFVPSPFALCFAGGFASAIWFAHKEHRLDLLSESKPNKKDVVSALAGAPCTLAMNSVYEAVKEAVASIDWKPAYEQNYAPAEGNTSVSAYKNWKPVPSWYKMDMNPILLADTLGVGEFGLLCSENSWRMYQGGNQWSAYDVFLSFFRHIAKLELDYSAWEHWETLSLHSGPRIIHPDFCMISDRPELLQVGTQNRPHNDAGPFCRWRDNSSLYSVNGVRVPWDVIEDPSSITVKRIETEQNAEVRRVMTTKFGEGRYIEESGLKPVHEDEFGRLYRKPQTGDEDLVIVRVTNPPLINGETPSYWLRVDPKCRTALEAVASTYSMVPKAYSEGLEVRT